MALDPWAYEDFINRFDSLSREDQQSLLDELEHRQRNGVREVESGRTLYDALNERGMAGSIKDAPADWSSNPQYLEGLGKDDR